MGIELEDLLKEIHRVNKMKTIGLLINPIAGMGGSVGLKGTDHVVDEAVRRGAVPASEKRAEASLKELLPFRDSLIICTRAGNMGGALAERMGFRVRLLLENQEEKNENGRTDREDTLGLARLFKEEGVDLLLFAGGDGTARDVYEAVGTELVCVGIPAGVKIHSPVYAKNPASAGKLAALWLSGKVSRTEEQEVLDIDEDAYRQEKINTSLYGYLRIPLEQKLIQNRKAPTPLSDEASIGSIAYEVTDNMEADTWYLIGAGTTTRGVMKMLGLKNTLIGVDLIRNKELVENDVYGEKILSRIRGQKVKLIVTITGGQGFLFGRGNQQLSPEVLRAVGKENIIILATSGKLSALRGAPLLVDTADEELNQSLCGYYRVITGYKEYTVCRVGEA